MSIGSFSRATISGTDLVLNDGNQLPGSSVFNLRCGREDNLPFVALGVGGRIFGRVEISAPSGFLEVNDRRYRARLTVIPQESTCLIVNTVELEKYVAGVIAKEMSPSWPQEALKAQAVAARSYALFQTQANRSRDFDVESTTQDQVYPGVEGEDPRSIQATEATRGLTLTYANSALKAYFHANCGGVTEVPDLVWGGEVRAFRSVACPYHHQTRDRARWSLHLTRAQVENALRKISGLLPQSFRRVASLEPGAPTPSQRLSDLAISDNAGNSLLISTNVFRNAIGNTKLKSTAFQIHREGKGFRLEGEGSGHGVGLCQVGARAMAEMGKTFRQILQFYYPLAQVKSLL